MRDPNDFITRTTKYTDVTIMEFGYNSLGLASHDYNSMDTTYKGCMISPIVHNNGKYWIVVEIPAWWVSPQ